MNYLFKFPTEIFLEIEEFFKYRLVLSCCRARNAFGEDCSGSTSSLEHARPFNETFKTYGVNVLRYLLHLFRKRFPLKSVASSNLRNTDQLTLEYLYMKVVAY